MRFMAAGNSKGDRTALLVRCSQKEAEVIRQAAKLERRTVSGYILNAVLQRIAVRNKTREQYEKLFRKPLDQG